MASTTVKSTYSLDPETVRLLERMADKWQVSKSEALRRAIRAAGGAPQKVDAATTERLAALHALQRSLKLTPAQATRWAKQVREERQATTRRIPRRSRR